MACTIDPGRSESINQAQTDQVAKWIDESVRFVADCYVPDALAIAGAYKDYFDIGAAQPNFLAVGMSGATFSGFPDSGRRTGPHPEIGPGVLLDGDYSTVHPFDASKIAEWVSSAWYSYTDGDVGLPPERGQTTVAYTGPTPPYEWLADNPEYTWCKAPRYDGRAVQVGPVARVLLAYAQGHERTRQIVDDAVAGLGIELAQINSTAGRTLARAVECLTSVEALAEETYPDFLAKLRGGDLEVFDATKWEPNSWPSQCQGRSFVEVARGNLSHWVSIDSGRVSLYQAVVPTTWLAGGRDAQGQMGPYEESLAGGAADAARQPHPLADPSQPLEPLRTIHSFDPCMSCAVHVLDPSGEELGASLS
jgi:hydrogenase large subunit